MDNESGDSGIGWEKFGILWRRKNCDPDKIAKQLLRISVEAFGNETNSMEPMPSITWTGSILSPDREYVRNMIGALGERGFHQSVAVRPDILDSFEYCSRLTRLALEKKVPFPLPIGDRIQLHIGLPDASSRYGSRAGILYLNQDEASLLEDPESLSDWDEVWVTDSLAGDRLAALGLDRSKLVVMPPCLPLFSGYGTIIEEDESLNALE